MKKAAVFLADGFEEIEAVTITDILRRGGISVYTVAVKSERLVKGAHGIKTEADMLFNPAFIGRLDAAILPGGMPGVANLESNDDLKRLLSDFYLENKIVAAICAAPMILGKMGLLRGKRACCYSGYENYLEGSTIEYGRVSHDGNIITSRGVSTAIDFALEIITTLTDAQTALRVKESIMYIG